MKKKKVYAVLITLAIAVFITAQPSPGTTQTAQSVGTFTSREASFNLTRVFSGLKNPWAIAFLPDGGLLVTERGGNLLLIENGRALPINGLPAISAGGQGGLLDIIVDPDFYQNRTVYFTYSTAGSGGRGTAAAKARLEGTQLKDVRVLWEMEQKTAAGQHFGSRIRILPDGTLLISTGDRGAMHRAQDLADAAGKTHRINTDGSIPLDNPFRTTRGALPSLYTLGHRNIQGLAIQPDTGRIWASEHGPQGGDEINIIESGKNYGWPVVTYGRQYGSGAKIGEGESKPGMENPVIQWTPSIAPSGLAFYSGEKFPAWKGNLFSGNLAGQRLVRMTIEDRRIISQEVLLQGTVGRIRDVKEGQDGLLYIITDATDGTLYRIEPVK